MKKTRATTTLFAACLGVAMALASAPAAHAAAAPFDVSNLRAGDIRIKAKGCVDLDVKATTNAAKNLHDVKAHVSFTSGRDTLNVMTLYRGSAPTVMDGAHQFCPVAGNRPGTYTIRIVKVDYVQGPAFADTTTGTLRARQDAKVAITSTRTKGSTRSFTVRSTHYDAVRSFAWKPSASGTAIRLQRRAAAGSGSWVTVKTGTVGSNGSTTLSAGASTKHQYRVVTSDTSTTWAAVSASVVR